MESTYVDVAELIKASRAGIHIWRDIPEYPGYQASTMGRIRNSKTGHDLRAQPIRSTPAKYTGTYWFASVKQNGRRINKQVSGLVAATFLGPRPEGATVNHVDLNKKNNALYNLEYLTLQENCEHGLHAGHYTKLDQSQATAVRLLAQCGQFSGREVGSAFAVGVTTVRAIKNYRTWHNLPDLRGPLPVILPSWMEQRLFDRGAGVNDRLMRVLCPSVALLREFQALLDQEVRRMAA